MRKVSKAIAYRDPIDNRIFVVITTKIPEKVGVGINFVHVPTFAYLINMKHGLRISNAPSDSVVDQIMVKNGCEFVKRLPVSPGEDFNIAYRIAQAYLMD